VEAAAAPSARAAGRTRLDRGNVPLPAIVLFAGLGLLFCAVAGVLSRDSSSGAQPLLWLGVLILALPIFLRLTSREASAGERFALVLLLGLSLFAVKVIRDAPLFTFSDELVHAFNANRIHETHHVFHENPIIEVTPLYPGLEGATSALMGLTGMSSYGAGIVLVGVARLLMMGSLFLLFTRISGSARTGGLGAALYTCNFNFFFWSAQFSYESLALPLLAVVLMAVAERDAAPRDWARSWALPICLALGAIVVTHHLTSYAATGILLVLSFLFWWLRKTWKPPNPWPFAVLAGLLALAWLVAVASETVGYLSPVITSAIEATLETAGGTAPPRQLFANTGPDIEATPLIARAVSLLAVVILLVGLPLGLRKLWARYRQEPFGWLFGIAAIGFFGTLALRLAPAAWETGNRLSEFLFMGLAFTIACIGVETWKIKGRAWAGRVLLTAAFGVMLVGGAISGWPWDGQLAKPLRVKAEGHEIVSPSLALAEWAKRHAPPGDFAASVADARLLLDQAGRISIAGESPDVQHVLENESLESWMLPLLRENGLRFVATDRSALSNDGARGYFFPERPLKARNLLPLSAANKFSELSGASHIYSNGMIQVFDTRGASE
jgi:hypothetical protein